MTKAEKEFDKELRKTQKEIDGILEDARSYVEDGELDKEIDEELANEKPSFFERIMGKFGVFSIIILFVIFF